MPASFIALVLGTELFNLHLPGHCSFSGVHHQLLSFWTFWSVKVHCLKASGQEYFQMLTGRLHGCSLPSTPAPELRCAQSGASHLLCVDHQHCYLVVYSSPTISWPAHSSLASSPLLIGMCCIFTGMFLSGSILYGHGILF